METYRPINNIMRFPGRLSTYFIWLITKYVIQIVGLNKFDSFKRTKYQLTYLVYNIIIACYSEFTPHVAVLPHIFC